MTRKRTEEETTEPGFEFRQAQYVLDAFARTPHEASDVNVYWYWNAVFQTSKARTKPNRKKEATDAATKYFKVTPRRIQQCTAQVRERIGAPISKGLERRLVDGEIFSQIAFTMDEATELLRKTENINVDLAAFRDVKAVVQPDSGYWAAATFANAYVRRVKAHEADRKRITEFESKIAKLEREKVKSTGELSVYQTGLTKSK